MIEPRLLDDAAIEELAEQMRQPEQRRADLRAQLAANRAGEAPHARARRPHRARRGARRPWTRSSTTPSGAPAPAWPSSPTARARPPTCSRRSTATSSCASPPPSRATSCASTSPARAGQHDGQPQLPAGGHPLGLLLRRARAHRPRHPAHRRRLPPDRVVAPEGSLLNAQAPAAVVAGNVETSSRVADLVLEAFGRALGQGTMNNLTLGNDDFTYYETLGGGQGACADADGPSGVHVAMSNTLNTPVEALELEFPLRVVEYAIRRGLGRRRRPPRRRRRRPRGRGARRRWTYSLLTERRRHRPARRRRRRGRRARARTCSTASRAASRRRRARCARASGCGIETPGGGGHGQSVSASASSGWGSWARGMAANLRRAGYELTVYNRTRETAEAWAPEHGAHVADTPARGRAAQRRRDHDGRRRRRRSRRCCSASDGVVERRAGGHCCSSTCRRSRPATRARIGERLAERGHRASSTRRSPAPRPRPRTGR